MDKQRVIEIAESQSTYHEEALRVGGHKSRYQNHLKHAKHWRVSNEKN